MSGIPPSVNEFSQRFAGRYFGKYRGIVTKVEEDPNKWVRIMARVPVILGPNEDVGWALPSAGGGGVDSGDVWPPNVNDIVWIEFEEGDPARPVWSHGPWGNRDNESMLPKHARGESDTIDTQYRDTGIIPASSFAGEYPNVRIRKSPSGHLIELDDTENEERVQIAHKDGSRIEMLADGSMELVTKDELRQYVSEAFKLEVMSVLEALIHQNASIESEQSLTIKSSGGEVACNVGSAPGVQVGGSSATEPFVMGLQWQSLMTNILTTLGTHTHPSTGAPPTEAVAILAYIAQLADVLSQYFMGK
jgi:hypothetical protein